MVDLDEDPLDLLQDGDDVIDVLTVLDGENEEKPILERTGCLTLVAMVLLPLPLIYYALSLI